MAPEAPLPHPFRPAPPVGGVPRLGAAELARAREGPDPPYLLDVRAPEERLRARLTGDHAIPLGELPSRLAAIPRGRPVVVYSHFGARSVRAARLLADQGVGPVAVLEGGIDEYARVVDPTIPRYRDEGDEHLLLQQFPRAATGCLSYLIADPVNRRAAVIDPGREVEPYVQALRAGRLELAAILETHTHADHLAGHAALAERTGAPIYLGRRSPAQYPHRPLEAGQGLEVGDLQLEILETPGHTSDHVTVRAGAMAFTGDTLLVGSCGRSDLADGDPEALWRSLNERIFTLPDATEVFPAHYGAHHALPERYSTTIGFERKTNEAYATGSLEAFRRYMGEGWPPKPTAFDSIVRENLAR